jgi:hypothetical protein
VAAPNDEPVTDGHMSPILEGKNAAVRTGVVYVEHVAGSERCSGALIAPHLVVTAAHCAFANDGLSTKSLPADGFRVGFGSSTDALAFAQVSAVSLPRADEDLTLAARIEAGLDVVALTLATPDNATEHYEIDLSFKPDTSTSLELVGFGISSTDTGESGRKLSGVNSVVGWNRERGILEVEGDSAACLGDSGGPALTTEGRWVGVISSVSAADNGVPCTSHTFLSTLLNDTLRNWILSLLEEATDDTPPVPPAGEAEKTPPQEPEPAPAHDVQMDDMSAESPYGACTLRPKAPNRGAAWLLIVAIALAHRVRGRRRT